MMRKIMYESGLDQKKLAVSANVTPSWLSQVLNTRRGRVDRDGFERIASVLIERLKNSSAARVSDEPVSAYLRFLTQFIPDDAVRALTIYKPGGIVPLDAHHYVKRRADDLALEALAKSRMTMLVRGPVQCGKSSLI